MATRRIPISSLNEVRAQLSAYRELLAALEEDGTLVEPTTRTYLIHAENFVRWLEGEWEPGTRPRNKTKR